MFVYCVCSVLVNYVMVIVVVVKVVVGLWLFVALTS